MIRYCSCVAIVIILSRRRFEASSKRLGVLWVTGLASGARGRRETPKLLNSPESWCMTITCQSNGRFASVRIFCYLPNVAFWAVAAKLVPCDATRLLTGAMCRIIGGRIGREACAMWLPGSIVCRSRFEMSDELSSRAWYESGQAGVGGCIHTPRGLVSGARLTGSR
jgi:hypothetical protein